MNAHICPEIGWRNTSRIHTAILSLVLIMGLTFIEVTPTRIATVKKVHAQKELFLNCVYYLYVSLSIIS